MCARFYRFKDLRDFYIRFKIQEILSLLEPQYNIAPTEPALVIPAMPGPRRAMPMAFGFPNPWIAHAGLLFNMKAESFMNKPGFKKYLQFQRCLIPADGFFEWRKTAAGSQPYGFRLKNEDRIGFAGIYDNNRFAIITTEANAEVRPVHHRMPVILRRNEEDLWLDATVTAPSRLIPLLAPYPDDQLVRTELSLAVNSAVNKTAAILEPRT